MKFPLLNLGRLHVDDERHGPDHRGHGADAADPGATEGFDLVDLLHLGSEHPKLGLHIPHVTAGPGKEAEENGDLLGHGQGREGQSAEQHGVFGAVAEKHFQRSR